MPERIQRRRAKGWRIPAGAVYVGRPSKWGNPFRVFGFVVGGHDWAIHYATHEAAVRASVNLFRAAARGIWTPSLVAPLDDQQYRNLTADRDSWKRRLCGSGHPVETIRAELRAHDLVCWCPLDQPCHADVLLELANGDPR